MLGVIRQSQAAQHCEGLGRERFIQLDDIYSCDVHSGARKSLRTAGSGPIPITLGGTPTFAMAFTRASGVNP
jgi:hypothetical protein